MFVSALAIMVFGVIVIAACVIIISIPFVWMSDRKDNVERRCENCTYRMGCACKLDGDNHNEADCCESWEEKE